MSGREDGKYGLDDGLRRALRAGRVVAWEWDLDTGHLSLSDNALEVLGWTSNVASHFDERVHPDDQSRHQAALQTTFTEGVPYDVEIRFLKPDGTVIWLKDAGELLISSEGHRILSGATTDITARKQMEERLRASEERLRLSQKAVGVGLWEINLETGELWLCPESLLMHGCSPDEPDRLARPEAWFDRIHPDDLAKAQDAFEQAMATGGLYDLIFRVPQEDGRLRWIHGLGRAISYSEGRPLRFIGLNIDVTAHKEAVAEAREKADILEATLGNMDQGLMMFDATETIRVHNRRALELLQLPPELLRDKPTFKRIREYQLTHGEFVHSSDAVRAWVASRGVEVGRDLYERVRPDGTTLEIRTVPLPDGGAVRTYTDVTPQRQAEAELRKSEERFRALATASVSIVWRAAPDGAILDGTGWSDFTGQFRSSAIPKGWRQAVHPDDQEQVNAKWQAAVTSGQLYENEYRLQRADGDYRWMYSRGVPIRNSDGSTREWIGTITDIHEQRLARDTLARSEAQYRLLAENATDVISTVDLQGIRRYVSPACKEVFGYEPEELIDQEVVKFVHPDDRKGLLAATDLPPSNGVSHITQTYRHQHKEGHWVWIESRHKPVCDDDGKPVGFVSILRDISERRQIEERLRQAQKMEAVGQLTGGVAHDFNNLLTVILGNAEMLAEHLEDERFRSMAQMILQSAERGADLTRHLLAFGRRQSLNPTRLRLDTTVREMLPLLQRAAGEHIELRTEFSPAALTALADRALFESALLNLVVNARDAMPQGGIIRIKTAAGTAGANDGQVPAGQDVVCVTVSDTGMGMKPEVLERAFEPFFTTKGVGQGSGLGLSMVYGFAEQSGGHVSIKSKEGEGTAVAILLRAVLPGAEQGEESTTTSLERGRERVLVVEDEPSVRAYVCSQLASLGYQLEAVASGPEALRILEKDRSFDLLLTDVVLPQGMSGVELARRATSISRNLKVLLTSGYSEEVFERLGKPDKSTLLLRKPYKLKELAATLRRALAFTH